MHHHLDLQTLEPAGKDQKTAPKTMLDSDSSTELPPDFPAESFYLAKEDEFEWFDRNAFYERNESTKGNSVSTTSNSNPTSQRFATNSKSKASSIIGLPKPQNSCYTNNHHRQNCNKPSNVRFFPKRLRSSGKSPIQLTEPSSPKVSCIGRVRSKRQGSRRQRLRRQRSKKGARPLQQAVGPEKKTGFWGNLKAAFMSKCRRKGKVGGSGSEKNRVDGPVSFVSDKTESRMSTASEPAGLGDMKRFTSGRRVESWVEAVGVDGDVEMGESGGGGGSVWGRRRLGPRKGVDCYDRDLVDVGPATC